MKTIGLLNLVKASRIHRTITGISAIMVPVSFAGKINLGIVLFCLSSILLYCAAGIQNAKKDNDYRLPKYTDKIVILLTLLAFFVSAFTLYSFIGLAIEFILGIIYNFYSRKILFGDVTVLSFSHFAWPAFISSALLGIDFALSLKISAYLFMILWFSMHVKNLKDKQSDRKRGYKTLSTAFDKDLFPVVSFFAISSAIALAGFAIFLGNTLGLIITGAISVKIIFSILQNQVLLALNYLRLFYLSVSVAFVIGNGSGPVISAIEFFIVLLYLIYNYSQNIKLNLKKFLGLSKKWKTTTL